MQIRMKGMVYEKEQDRLYCRNADTDAGVPARAERRRRREDGGRDGWDSGPDGALLCIRG